MAISPDNHWLVTGSSDKTARLWDLSYEGRGRLKGRHALITGADSGIGRAVALAFAREGADVAISYLSEEKDARETERLVTETGRQAILLPGDIGEPSESKVVARKAIDGLGTVDILVNNAAFQRTYENFEDISDDEFEETYRVNVFAMFRLCKALLPQMKEGGSIINTGSIQSFDPSSNLIAYASTKAAIVSFTRSLASSRDQAWSAGQRRSPRSRLDSPYSLHDAQREGETVRLSDCVRKSGSACRARPYLRFPIQRSSQLCHGRNLRSHRRSNADLRCFFDSISR